MRHNSSPPDRVLCNRFALIPCLSSPALLSMYVSMIVLVFCVSFYLKGSMSCPFWWCFLPSSSTVRSMVNPFSFPSFYCDSYMLLYSSLPTIKYAKKNILKPESSFFSEYRKLPLSPPPLPPANKALPGTGPPTCRKYSYRPPPSPSGYKPSLAFLVLNSFYYVVLKLN